jgi:MoxR-like ATPase
MEASISRTAQAAERLRSELGRAIVGQREVVDLVIVALLADGHVLLEGVPGVAKTLLVRALALACSLPYRRIQFTPDLMPSDVTGTNVYNAGTGTFELRKGPIFTSVLLADEINRTPPKTQAALLEAMEERRATIDGEPQPLPSPFVVFATQNPIEYEGTYPLPEAQLDRFLMKVLVGYPAADSELEILRRHDQGFRANRLEDVGIGPVLSADELHALRKAVAAVRTSGEVLGYMADVVRRSREAEHLVLGASPRAGIAILACAKAVAAMHGRDFVTPDDVKVVLMPVLRHRVLLRPEAEIEGMDADAVLSGVVAQVAVPR